MTRLRPGSPVFLALGLAVAALCIVGVVLGRAERTEASIRVAILSPEGGCMPARVELAAERYRSRGWDVTVAPGGTPIRELTPGLEALAPHDARGVVATMGVQGREELWVLMNPDACGELDPALEHEVGNLLGLRDGGPAGTVMATPHTRTGLRIPRRVDP